MFCFNLLSNGHRIENATNPLIAEIFIHRTSQVSQADRHDFKHMRCRYTRIVFFFIFVPKYLTVSFAVSVCFLVNTITSSAK